MCFLKIFLFCLFLLFCLLCSLVNEWKCIDGFFSCFEVHACSDVCASPRTHMYTCSCTDACVHTYHLYAGITLFSCLIQSCRHTCGFFLNANMNICSKHALFRKCTHMHIRTRLYLSLLCFIVVCECLFNCEQ